MTKRDERLTRIIRVKERVRDARRGDLADAEASEQVAEQHLERAAVRVEEARASYTGSVEVTAAELALLANAVTYAITERERARADLERAREERDLRADALAMAGRELRSLELLETRRDEASLIEERRREQELLDDSSRFGGAA
ncbi:MAG: flagellar FliJ family protein [Sandaracinaceae bacterium]